MRIGIVGAGLSGLAAAHYLSDDPSCSITVLEAGAQLGGRANVTQDGEHCTRLFLPDYRYMLQLLAEVPAPGGGTVRETLEASRRYARVRSGRWLEIDHIYAFLSTTPGLTLRDKWDISKANRESLLVAKKAQKQARRALGRRGEHAAEAARGTGAEDSLNVFAPVWNWTPGALVRAVHSARSSGTTYALPGATDRHLIDPWAEHLRSRGVALRTDARVEALRLDGDGVELRTAATAERFDAVLVTAFAADAYALLDRSGIPRPLDHRGHTHCKCFTVDLDPREAIVQDPGTRIYSHGGMTTVVQPQERRCVTLATFTASTEQGTILEELRRQLALAHPPLRVRCRTNLDQGEAVFVGTYVDPVALAAPLAPRVHFAGSWTDNSYAVDSGEGACRSAYEAAVRIAAAHGVRIRSNEGLPSPVYAPRSTGVRTPPSPPLPHPNAHPRPRRARRLWDVLCGASALVARGVAELTFLDRSGAAWPLGEPAVYVANHRSIFDVPAGLLTFRQLKVFPRLVVARKYFDGPGVAGLRAIGALPALRSSDATVTAATAAVRHGESVGFMVEGRITSRAEAETAAHGRGAVATALRTGAPIVPIGAWGTDDVWRGSRPWPLVRRRRARVAIAIGAPIRPDGLSPDELELRVRERLRELELHAGRHAGAPQQVSAPAPVA